jgi:hypothetical protein
MRLIIWLIMLIMGIDVSAFSQTTRFGLTAGAGISNVTKTRNIGVAFEQRNPVADYFMGLTAQIKINNDFAFKPELLFEQKGWTSKYNNLMINLRSSQPYFVIGDSILNADKAKMDYIKMPLNLSFSLPQVIDGKISVELGPYFAYAISGSYNSFYGNSSTSVYNFTATLSDENSKAGIKFNRFDYGLNIKMGYELNFGLLIQAKYELGLRNAVVNQLVEGSPETKFKSLLLELSYPFNK